ncbi:MAG: S-methyl-5'-thioadenosine phosphorylase [Endomicrobiales bacterium]|nr:S-methyl-5'-thioadenosine phosphorylase [Endomicrobiales bacterium]
MAKTAENRPTASVAVIGGSGLYEIDGIEDVKTVKVKTPFGRTSDDIVVGSLGGVRCAFIPRHGRGHYIMPSEVNSRANIFALKTLGVEKILSISACGSLKEEVKPRDFLIPDQVFDRTKNRPSTFFGGGIVVHIGFAEPFCGEMRDTVHRTVKELGITHHFGGTYVCIEGPQFSTKAESEVNRKMGFSIVGMTVLPEAKLAREAGMCYATVGLVTDYDVWKEGEEVSVEKVLAAINQNVSNSKRLIKHVVPVLAAGQRRCRCGSALENALMTKPGKISRSVFNKLKPIIGNNIKL